MTVISSDGWSTANTLITTLGALGLAWISWQQAKSNRKLDQAEQKRAEQTRKLDQIGNKVVEMQTQIGPPAEKEE